jgi:hypothetical protein
MKNHKKIAKIIYEIVVGLPNNSYKYITNTAWVRVRLCTLQERCTRLAAATDALRILWLLSPIKLNHKKIAKIIYEIVLTSITISGNIHRIKVAYAELYKYNVGYVWGNNAGRK